MSPKTLSINDAHFFSSFMSKKYSFISLFRFTFSSIFFYRSKLIRKRFLYKLYEVFLLLFLFLLPIVLRSIPEVIWNMERQPYSFLYNINSKLFEIFLLLFLFLVPIVLRSIPEVMWNMKRQPFSLMYNICSKLFEVFLLLFLLLLPIVLRSITEVIWNMERQPYSFLYKCTVYKYIVLYETVELLLHVASFSP